MGPFLALLLLLSISSASSRSPVEIFFHKGENFGHSAGEIKDQLCKSWRLAVETNNLKDWNADRVQERCAEYVKEYITGGQYDSDFDLISKQSLDFAKLESSSGTGMDGWVFGLDDTLLSNIGQLGWKDPKELSSDAPSAIPSSLWLYNELKNLGYKLFILSGRSEHQRNETVSQLLNAGYDSWTRLILRDEADTAKTTRQFKSEKREELGNEGYILRGSSGDQWSDLMGYPMALRSFKLPNPIYFME
ncbi:acid phosphatase 1-like [Typha angustifolia]|uniref:acid phosphatase 1-like n=1 Tax=Typha angustifolia TaxID=59011 RepID=UPI003C2EDDBD